MHFGRKGKTYDAKDGVAFAPVSESLVDDIMFLRRFLAGCILELCHPLVDLVEVYEGETCATKEIRVWRLNEEELADPY